MRRSLLALTLTAALLLGGVVQQATAAQNTACIGAAEFTANHQLAEQAVSAQVQQHAEIYNKESADLTPDDVQTIAADVAFYASQLAQINAPLAAQAALTTEIAMYYTLSALLYSATLLTADLSAVYDDAGSSLGGAMQVAATELIATCAAYDATYGDYVPDTV